MSKTITLADATITDLAGQVCTVTTPPPPSGTMTAPFVCDAQNPVATLVTSPDGPIVMVSYDTNTKLTWLHLRSYLVGDSKHGIYSGCFIEFQCMKDNGVLGGAVAFNAGYVDGTPGKEQGDLDIFFPVDGQQTNVSFTGRYTPALTNPPTPTVTYPPGVLCWPPDLLYVGTNTNRYKGGGYTVLPVRPGMPSAANGCIDMGGGHFVPTYP